MKTPDIAMIVLAKEPLAGRVKTRLCPPFTYAEAAHLAAAALQDTLEIVAATPAARRVLVLQGTAPRWLPEAFEVIGQRAGALDVRLAGAFADVTGPALLVGMDTPQLTPRLLQNAADELLAPDVDAILGPALDGGWWTVGLRCSEARAFLGVPTSLPTTGALQLERLHALGLRTTTIQPLVDVDDFRSAAAVAAAAPQTRFAKAFERFALSTAR